jgi:hypothetical protein
MAALLQRLVVKVTKEEEWHSYFTTNLEKFVSTDRPPNHPTWTPGYQ